MEDVAHHKVLHQFDVLECRFVGEIAYIRVCTQTQLLPKENEEVAEIGIGLEIIILIILTNKYKV